MTPDPDFAGVQDARDRLHDVGYLTDEAIRRVMAAITDEEHLLRIGLFIEAKDQVTSAPSLTNPGPDAAPAGTI